jgi:hypothetical protein
LIRGRKGLWFNNDKKKRSLVFIDSSLEEEEKDKESDKYILDIKMMSPGFVRFP